MPRFAVWRVYRRSGLLAAKPHVSQSRLRAIESPESIKEAHVMRFLKFVGFFLLAVVAIAAVGIGWLSLRPPKMQPASAEKVEATPARLARGEYLTHHVADCF